MLKVGITLFLLGVSSVAAVRLVLPKSTVEQIGYQFASVQRQTIATTIDATGTLEPCEIIDVGAQVAGRIIEFGIDPDSNKPLDYGSRVTKGMVLARIDPLVYEVEVAIAEAQSKRSAALLSQAIAQLKESEASVRRSDAELLQHQSRLQRAERDWIRIQGLDKSDSASDSEVDIARSEVETMKASVIVAQAAIEQARGRLESQHAAIQAASADAENSLAVLKRATTTLDYCSIVSPIAGTIIDRRVNLGQTVVASLSAPSLFLLASDLSELEIWVSVNEADVGQIKPSMPVRFTVDALPEEIYTGTVKQVRLNASMSQNVVTYTVVVSVHDRSSQLLPYLTANVEFIVDEHENVLCVPSAALRFRPKTMGLVAEADFGSQPTVWVSDVDGPKEIPVEVGLKDGSMVEIESEHLRESTQVITGYLEVDEVKAASNPFVPKMPGTDKKKPKQ